MQFLFHLIPGLSGALFPHPSPVRLLGGAIEVPPAL